ncbi:MAG: BamA/TamA family outer membrane protein, partial [Cytophagales bacterium]|nr:BamA/TamA family outer membrane protein [Cytophagales bacterium]
MQQKALFLRVLLALLVVFPAAAQPARTLLLRPVAGEPVRAGGLSLPLVRKNVRDVAGQLRQLVLGLHGEGFVLASVDSLHASGDTTTAWLYVGEAFRWVNLRPGNVPEALLREAGYKERLLRGEPFSYAQLARLEARILTGADNGDYPFATVGLDSVALAGNTVAARLRFAPGPYIIFDTLAVAGTARIKPAFLAAYLRLQKGHPYSEAGLQRGQAWLRQLPYVSVRQAYSVTLRNDRAYPVYYLDARRANAIDGLVGLQPNEQENNRLLVTGQLNLQLRNLLGSGKSFLLQWQQIRRASPRLDVTYEHPAFLRTPLTVRAHFQLLKEDTTFLNVNQQLGLAYPLQRGALQSWVRLRSSRLGTVAAVSDSLALPDYGDTRLLTYGLGYEWQHLDDPFYPLRGASLSISAEAGNKTIARNPLLKAELYEGVPASSAQFSVQAEVKKFIALSRRATLLIGARGGKIINRHLFRNELFRLGGLTTLRGFNENFFFASEYGAGTLEYR